MRPAKVVGMADGSNMLIRMVRIAWFAKEVSIDLMPHFPSHS